MADVWDELGWTDPDRRDAAADRMLARIRAAVPPEAPLTHAELRVVRALSHGRGERGAADVCGIGYETVRSHTLNARRKLRAKNTTHLVGLALREGLID